MKVHEMERETFYRAHGRQLTTNLRPDRQIEKCLGVLAEEDMHSLSDYLELLSLRHAENAQK